MVTNCRGDCGSNLHGAYGYIVEDTNADRARKRAVQSTTANKKSTGNPLIIWMMY